MRKDNREHKGEERKVAKEGGREEQKLKTKRRKRKNGMWEVRLEKRGEREEEKRGGRRAVRKRKEEEKGRLEGKRE